MTNNQSFPLSILEELNTTGAGHDVLRYISLPNILGEQANTLLYFAGRNLARKLEIKSLQDICYAFEKLGWGNLELVKEKKHSFNFHLMADAVVHRLQAPFHTEFHLEAGFLAEAWQIKQGKECECIEKINRRIHQVQFKVFYTE